MQRSEIFGALIADALASGMPVQFRADGHSMYPTIRDGEAITVAAVAAEDVGGGDILLCRHGARWLAHRVTRVMVTGGRRQFELRGDAKAGCDAPVDASAVIGKVVSVRRNGRHVALCGRAARWRRAARSTASRVKTLAASTSGALSTIVAALPSIAARRGR